ncbi:MAG: phospholipase [Candidatus Hydrogenedentota bacterium]
MFRQMHFAALGVAIVAGGCMTTGQGTMSTGFINKTSLVGNSEVAYSVYVPRDYSPEKEWPLVIFLHGMGERGSDGLLQTEVGIGRAIRRNPERFHCIVAMPQCPVTSVWPNRHDVIQAALDQSLVDYSIDKNRIYLTGLSMGGYGTWSFGAEHPEYFAALLPVCGGGDPAKAASLATIPIRVYHGASDSVVAPEKSREMVDAVKAAGGKIEYTEYPGVDHNSWDQTYGDPEVIAWLLSQKK